MTGGTADRPRSESRLPGKHGTERNGTDVVENPIP